MVGYVLSYQSKIGKCTFVAPIFLSWLDGRNMERDELKQLASDAIEEYLQCIDSIVGNIVSKIVEKHKIENEDDIDYLKAKIRHEIFKMEID